MKIHKMKIKDVLVNPVCYGPIEYRIAGECSACNKAILLVKCASLLSEDQFDCNHCGARLTYRYDPRISGDSRTEKVISLEKAIMEKFRTNRESAVATLGHDFLFSINAYFTNRLK